MHTGDKKLVTGDEKWNLPFFTLLNILRNLSPTEILNVIETSNYLKQTYKYINKSSTFKFVYDNRFDVNTESLKSTNKIKHVFIDMYLIDETNRLINVWELLNTQPLLSTLTIIDQGYLTQTLTCVNMFVALENLTTIKIFGLHADKEIHSIQSLILAAPNLRELTYGNGNLFENSLKHMNKITKLELFNVTIDNDQAFADLLHKSRHTLKFLLFDLTTCCTILSEIATIRVIYDSLYFLDELTDLKIMAGNNLCNHENLEIPRRLKDLTIYCPEHLFINSLFVTLKRIVVNNLTLEFRHCIHHLSPIPKYIKHIKNRYLMDIKIHQENAKIKFIRPITFDH